MLGIVKMWNVLGVVLGMLFMDCNTSSDISYCSYVLFDLYAFPDVMMFELSYLLLDLA